MSAALRILIVGAPESATGEMLERLLLRGWASYSVDSLAEAQAVLQTIQFDVILAAERLPDGRGYDLSPSVAVFSGTLLVCVSLSESFLWLPVLVEGSRVLGKRAIHHDALEFEIEDVLASARYKRSRAAAHASGKKAIPPRRRGSPEVHAESISASGRVAVEPVLRAASAEERLLSPHGPTVRARAVK